MILKIHFHLLPPSISTFCRSVFRYLQSERYGDVFVISQQKWSLFSVLQCKMLVSEQNAIIISHNKGPVKYVKSSAER